MSPDTRKNPYMVIIMRLLKSNMSTKVTPIAVVDNIILTSPSHGNGRPQRLEHPVQPPTSGVGGRPASSNWWSDAYFFHLVSKRKLHLKGRIGLDDIAGRGQHGIPEG